MIDNYTKRFEFIYNPFLKDTNEHFVETQNYKELLMNLNYVIKTKGIGVVVGDPGTGKTSATKKIIESLPRNLYKPIYTTMSTLTVREFYHELGRKFGITEIYTKVSLMKEIKNQIISYHDAKKIVPVIVIDEANYLSNAILNDLKMLLNFNMDSENKAILILIGLPNLINTLELVIHQPLNQRITSKAFFEPMSQKEAKEYLQTKIEKAGSHLSYFDPDAIEAVINGGKGIPRIIDRIMDKSLMLADNMNVNAISLELVKKVIQTL